METFCHLHECWYTVIGKHNIILPSPYTDLYSICGFQTDFKSMRPFFNCVGVLLVSGREDNGWTQRSLGNKDIIKVSPSIPSLDLFHLQEPAFTGKELLNHLKWQTELIELLVRNQQQVGMLRDVFAQPGSWCTNLSNTRCSAYGIGGTLWSNGKGTRPPFSKCYSTFRDCPSSPTCSATNDACWCTNVFNAWSLT